MRRLWFDRVLSANLRSRGKSLTRGALRNSRLRSFLVRKVCHSFAKMYSPVQKCLIDLMRPARGHSPISPPCGLYGMPSLCRCA